MSKTREQFARAGAHGGGASADGELEKFDHQRAHRSVLLRKIPKPLQRKGFDDRAAVFEIDSQLRRDALRFRRDELQARNHHSQMPANFLLDRLLNDLLTGASNALLNGLLVRFDELRFAKC